MYKNQKPNIKNLRKDTNFSASTLSTSNQDSFLAHALG